MKRDKSSSVVLSSLVVLLIFCAAFSMMSVEARKSRHAKKPRTPAPPHKLKKGRSDYRRNFPAPAPSPTQLPPGNCYPPPSNVFDILSFGAKGDGVSDDSKVDGNVVAPPNVGSWPKSSIFQWINFKWVHSFTIRGPGTFDGQGPNWWKFSQIHNLQEKKASETIHLNMKPTALRFYESYNVTIHGISIVNSPQCHLKFDNSKGVNVHNITISAPQNSPNTDGIHLQNTQDVEIHHSTIGSGDDCVSIQTGCSNVHVHHINCGPGHGISLGGLGKDKSVACVSNILVENVVMENTLYGARIKTWQGGIGSVKNVSFSDIQVSDVKVPIMIDQYYCDKHVCKNQTGAVAIQGVKFDRIVGTFAAQPFHLACSNAVPCTDVHLADIQLEPSAGFRGFRNGQCWNSYGKSLGQLFPVSMDYCLRSGSLLVKRIARALRPPPKNTMTTQKVIALVAVAAVLLLCHGADAFLPAFIPGSKINPFCQTATSKRLCTRMVGGASTLHDASANAIKATLKLAKEIESMSVGAVIPAVAKLKGVTKDSILETCHDSFENAVDDLNISLQALDADDHMAVMTRLSAALPSDCGDALKEFGVSFPLQNIVKFYARYLDSALAVVSQQ
nr:polygalacturonase At1g48100 [Ipomoea batatas]